MAEFFSVVKCVFVCGTVIFVTCVILLALPQCKLRYVGLECMKWVVMAGLLLLVAMPIDLLPGLPIDDMAYLVGAYWTGKSAFKDRRRRMDLEEAENAYYAELSRKATEPSPNGQENQIVTTQE